MAVTTTYTFESAGILGDSGLAAGTTLDDITARAGGGLVAISTHAGHSDVTVYDNNLTLIGGFHGVAGTSGEIATLANGNLLFVTNDTNVLRYYIYNESTGTYIDQSTIGGSDISYAEVEALSGGNFVVGALVDAPGTAVWDFQVQVRNVNGFLVRAFTIENANLGAPWIDFTALDGGGFAAAWYDFDAGQKYAIFNSDGTVYRGETVNPAGNDEFAITSVDGGGFVIFSFDRYGTGDLTLDMYNEEGNFVLSRLVDADAGGSHHPLIRDINAIRLANGVIAVTYGDEDQFVRLFDPALNVLSPRWQVTGGEDPADGQEDLRLAELSNGWIAALHNNPNDSSVNGETLQGVRVSTGDGANDVIVGDRFIDRMFGAGGNDSLSGGLANDLLDGGAGNDILNGGSGNDEMRGGTGDDTYYVDSFGDIIVEAANAGTDTIRTALSYSIAALAVEHIILTGSSNSSATGNASNNHLTGNSGNNVLLGDAGRDGLFGGAGNDTLNGGAGVDAMTGGAGNDIYVVDEANETVDESPAGSNGIDQINASISISLVPGSFIFGAVENALLLGSANINATGNDLNNLLTGNTGNNVLSGGAGLDILSGNAGNDTLDGGAGGDTMVGGTGNDIYYVDNTLDDIAELTGQGTDTVFSSISLSVATQYIENLTLTGSADTSAMGNTLANVLTGNTGNNTLNGGQGNDTLDAGLGADTLTGGAGIDVMRGGGGNDLYIVDDLGDRADESIAGSNGIDTVQSSVTFNLGSQSLGVVENVTLAGSAAINALGNSAANTLTGNAGNNLIAGGNGNDTLTGGGGDDAFLFNGALNASTNVDTITDMNASGNDTIRLENAIFTTLAAGILSIAEFKISTTGATQLDDRIVYNNVTGELTYDSNGLAAGNSTVIAILGPGLALTAADFLLV